MGLQDPVIGVRRSRIFARPAGRARIGDILVGEGALDPVALSHSLILQGRSHARIGDILIATGAADRGRVAAAAAHQQGVEFTDLNAIELDSTALTDADLNACLRDRCIPLHRDAGGVVFASRSIRPIPYSELESGTTIQRPRMVLAEDRAIQARLISTFGPELASRAALRRPEATSHRGGTAIWLRIVLFSAMVGLAALAILLPYTFATFLLTAAAMTVGSNGALWTLSMIFGRSAANALPSAEPVTQTTSKLPKVTLLVPLFHEPEAAPMIVRAIAALDYPPELLDVKFILETGDEATCAAFQSLKLPPFADVLIAPAGSPQTKPRALNFAVEFADGEIIGIYDAEDQPAPDQVRQIVAQFAVEAPDVACIQARLGYYNTSENWLTRCFEIEYASWFDVMLPGLTRLGCPLPLGGTSLFIRREVLEEVGGWDSHNVTEDADLGMMLARAGLKTALSKSITLEEASSTPLGWVKQRSRWLKGYLATWMTHMRRPVALWRSLGTAGFIGFHAILLSAATGYLALPLLWLAAICPGCFGADMSPSVSMALTAASITSLACLPALALAAISGLRRREGLSSWPWIFALPIYWVLGAAAAYIAVWELFRAPTKWRKTRHGLGRIAGAMCEEAGKGTS